MRRKKAGVLEGQSVLVKPLYCSECKGRGTFERYQEADIVGAESGKVLWKVWKCSVCGKKMLSSLVTS